MDRKRQLSNVAFGGAWSEQIAGAEALRAAMTFVDDAVGRTVEEDLREDQDLERALSALCREHPKGAVLKQGWGRALGLANPMIRTNELGRLARLLRVGLGKRV